MLLFDIIMEMKVFLLFFCLALSGPLYADSGWILPYSTKNLSQKSLKTRHHLDQAAPVVRSKVVTLDLDQLWRELDQGRFSFTFFEDARFEGIPRLIRHFKDGGAVYAGEARLLEGTQNAPAQFTFTVYEGIMALELQMGRRIFAIRGLGDGQHLVQELDSLGFAGCGLESGEKRPISEGTPHEAWSQGGMSEEEKSPTPDLDWEDEATIDNGNYFDVITYHSTATRALNPDIKAQIRLAVGLANVAYFQSKVNTRMRLILMKELIYTEGNDFNVELNALSGTSDGKNDEIHEEIRTHGADFVAMVSSIVTGLCGLAQLGTLPMDKNKVFSVTATSCITNFTLHHEIGHNMGLNHELSAGSGIFGYSYGYHSGTIFRTVMSTATECAACPRVNYFANPNIMYSGVPMGLAGTADDHRSINEVASKISAYKEGLHVDNNTTDEDELINKDCFIATAAYGTPYAPELFFMRQFRNQVLAKFSLGQKFIEFYQRYSPPIAQVIARSQGLRFLTLTFLIPLIYLLKYPALLLLGLFLPLFYFRRSLTFFLTLTLVMVSVEASAQVALPPLDPSFPVLMPAATGWRTTQRGTIKGHYILETREDSFLFVKSRTTRMGVSGGVSVVTSRGGLELVSRQSNSGRKHANGKDEFRQNEGALHLAIGTWKTGKLGLGASYLNQVLAIPTRTNSLYVFQSGLSQEVAKFLYLAGGLNFYHNERTNAVINQWFERMLAVAFRLTESMGPQLELSWTHSPRRRQQRDGSLQVNHHAQTDVIRASAEFKFVYWMLHVDASHQKEQSSSDLDNSHGQMLLRVGAGVSPPLLPIVFGLYGTTGQDKVGLDQDSNTAAFTKIQAVELSSSFIF